MGLFGENLQEDQFSTENPLGIKRAPEEGAANSGEPTNGEIAAGQNGVEQNLNQMQKEDLKEGQKEDFTGEQVSGVEHPEGSEGEELLTIDNVDVSDDLEKKTAFIKQKFNGPNAKEKFIRSVEELQKKLGKNEDLVFKNNEEGINYYIELEKELGRTSNVDNVRRENQQLKQDLQGLRDTLNQFVMQQQGFAPGIQPGQQGQAGPYLQNNIPYRNPVNGQFVSPSAQQNVQPQTQLQTQQKKELDINSILNEVDTDKFMKEFYEKGPKAESFQKILTRVAEIAEKKANDAVNKTLTEQQKQIQSQQQLQQQRQQQALMHKQSYDNQIKNIKQQYGEQEFESNKQNILNFLQKYPVYLDTRLFPNGFEIAFNETRQANNNYQQQQRTIQNQQQYNAVQKMAARMPSSQPSQSKWLNQNKPNQEEIEKQMIFNAGANAGGLFG